MAEIHYKDSERLGSAVARSGNSFANSAIQLQRVRQLQAQQEMLQYQKNLQYALEQQKFQLEKDKFKLTQDTANQKQSREKQTMDAAVEFSNAIKDLNAPTEGVPEGGIGPLTQGADRQQKLQSAFSALARVAASTPASAAKLAGGEKVSPGQAQLGPLATFGGPTNPVYVAPNPLGEERNRIATQDYQRKVDSDAERARHNLVIEKPKDEEVTGLFRERLAQQKAQEEYDAQRGFMGRIHDRLFGRPAIPQGQAPGPTMAPSMQQPMTNGPQVQAQQSPMPPQPAQDPGLPRVGQIYKGHRYVGGNPADPASWESLTQ